MASTKEFKDYILEQLRELDNIECRYMMGEYVLYYHGIVFGGIYDDRFLIKKTNSNEKYNLKEAIPYPKGKPMYMIENIDDTIYLAKLIQDTYFGLNKNPR